MIGVDPGPTPGIVRLHIEHGRLVSKWTHVVQCSANVMPELVGAFVTGHKQWDVTFLAVETFVARGRLTADQRTTAHQVDFLTSVYADAAPVQRNAATVKAWATDQRLEAAGLLEACKGMRHARDAGRHALYAAVADAGLPDPLSKHFSLPTTERTHP